LNLFSSFPPVVVIAGLSTKKRLNEFPLEQMIFDAVRPKLQDF